VAEVYRALVKDLAVPDNLWRGSLEMIYRWQ
jgi:hypothetical protein